VEQRGKEALGTGAILGYARVEKKVTKEPKVKGGSRIEVTSAGYDHGNQAQILLNGDQVMTIRNQYNQVKMQEATMSSNSRKGTDLNT